jgi:hypothetical protein
MNVISFRLDTKKLTLDLNKVEGFELRMNSSKKATYKGTKADILVLNKANFTMIEKIQEKEEENKGDESPDKVPRSEPLPEDNSEVIAKIQNQSKNNEYQFFLKKSEDEVDEEDDGFLKESTGVIPLFSSNNMQSDSQEKISMITGLNISSIKDERDKLNKSNLTSMKRLINSIDTNKIKDAKGKKYSCFTDYTGDRTIDYSSMEDDKSPSSISQTILRKYNLNPYHNFNVVKKYFIYQLKKSFLQAKKFVLNSAIHGQMKNDLNKNPNYHEIFANYSQISTTNVNSYVKYEDHNVQINNYFIKKDKILGKGGYSTVYVCKNLTTSQEHVKFNKFINF